MDEIERNDYNCNIPRYVDGCEEETVDIAAQMRIIRDCNTRLANIEKQLSTFLKELGMEEKMTKIYFGRFFHEKSGLGPMTEASSLIGIL